MSQPDPLGLALKIFVFTLVGLGVLIEIVIPLGLALISMVRGLFAGGDPYDP